MNPEKPFFMYDKDEEERFKLLKDVDEIVNRKTTPESRFLKKFIFELINAAHEQKTNSSNFNGKIELTNVPKPLQIPEFKSNLAASSKQEMPENMSEEDVKNLPLLPITRILPILPKKDKETKITIKKPQIEGDFPYLGDRNMIEHEHLKEQEEGLIQRYIRDSQQQVYAPKITPKFKIKTWNDLDLYMKTPRIDAIYCDGAGIPVRVSYSGRMFKTETIFKDNKEIEEFIKKIFSDMKIYETLEPIINLKLKNGFELHAIIGKGNIKTRFILTRVGAS